MFSWSVIKCNYNPFSSVIKTTPHIVSQASKQADKQMHAKSHNPRAHPVTRIHVRPNKVKKVQYSHEDLIVGMFDIISIWSTMRFQHVRH
jgi:DNA-binding transcriptional regulator/RsmH inhibitor MraZ